MQQQLGAICVLIALGSACSSGDGGGSVGGGGDGGPNADGGQAQAGSFGNSGSGGSGGTGQPGPFDAGTTDGGGEPPPSLPGVMALRIEPDSREIEDDGEDPGETTEFTAIGTFEDGERDVTALVAWSLEDDELGEIDGGEFTSAGHGGRSEVRARAAGVEATAELTVTLDLSVQAEGAPDGIEELFEPDPDDDIVVDDDGLRIVYPSHQTMFPRNLERVDHQWRADAALDRFELRFESELATLRFYTDQKHLMPDLQAWRWIANTHAGRSLKLSVRGLSSDMPEVIMRSQEITLHYSRSEVIGALYYWSTGSQGVMKATISSAFATKFFTDPEADDDTCVACHTVSRNGQRLSAGYGGEKLRAITVPNRDVLVPSDPEMDGPGYGWGTFSPDASRLLYANKGVLALIDAESGDPIDDVELPTGFKATHPDWAPNGEHVAIAHSSGTSKADNKNAQGSSIAAMEVARDGSFEAPEILLQSEGADDSLFFPSYSPNSAWIAFVRAVGKSKDNVTSTIYLLPEDGGDPIDLTRLNTRVRHEDDVEDTGNSMPTWAPSTKPDIFWIAFSSVRAYGDVIPDGGRDQLWAAAIDPEKIGTDEDPSYAAFWLPFQDVNEGNHRAFWAIDTEVECPSRVEVCDDLDNDCDGVVDEECCEPSEEECNGEDDNCDGVVDEGCCMASTEACDGEDNDCDLEVDESCCEPSPEVCDGEDNDCDLVADDGCGCMTREVCDNGEDDDCDALVDEECVI